MINMIKKGLHCLYYINNIIYITTIIIIFISLLLKIPYNSILTYLFIGQLFSNVINISIIEYLLRRIDKR